MCGITGIVYHEPSTRIAKSLKLMNDAIAHRGPDDEGFAFFSDSEATTAGGKCTPENLWKSGIPYQPAEHIDNISRSFKTGLGHRRLSIIDLSETGHQPMCIENGNVWITYNGEIYNYIELREELKNLGHSFNTASDTEVILHAYLQWGKECVSRFNGMWAFVIYDKNKQLLFGSRDRLGVKPFYYYHDKEFFAFASEQKALLKLPSINTGINPAAVYDYFILDQIEYEEEGMFKNIIELLPSHCFIYNISGKSLSKWQYYQLPFNPRFEIYNEQTSENKAKELKEYLYNSISLRLRSDVPVGACLSGGLDSSTITGIMTEVLGNRKPDVFTASFHDKKIDESHWAETVAKHTGANWHQVFPESNELMADLEKLTYCQDIPIWSSSTYAQYRVMQLVKEKNIKVILDGQGGDELFAGYAPHQIAFWCELLKQGKFGLLAAELKNHSPLPVSLIYFLKQYLKWYGINRLNANNKSKILFRFFAEFGYLNKDFTEQHKNRLENKDFPSKTTLNGRLHYEMSNRLLKSYLKCEDRCSMFHSVESRTPFADDHHLIEFSMNIPSVYKIRNGEQKHILRKAIKGILPETVIARKDKMGYLTPNNQWVNDIKPELKDLFNNPVLEDIMDLKKINKDFDSLFNTTAKQENGKLFKFISFAMWAKVFREQL
jgi:asparagine synthase (glutamine-hydrolysing)